MVARNMQEGFQNVHNFFPTAHTVGEVRKMKEKEKKPNTWEAVDPKPPVIQSGHMENRVQN